MTGAVGLWGEHRIVPICIYEYDLNNNLHRCHNYLN